MRENKNTTCPTARLAADRQKWKTLWGATDCLAKGGTPQGADGGRALRRRIRGKQAPSEREEGEAANTADFPENPPRRRVRFKQAPGKQAPDKACEEVSAEDKELDLWMLYGDAPADGPAKAPAIRAASARFKRSTCAVDGWHPQHFNNLSDGSLARLGLIFWMAECVGQFPEKAAMFK